MLEKRLVSLAAALIVLLGSDSSVFAAAGVTGGRMFSYNPNPVTSAMGDAGVALISGNASSSILNPASTIDTYRITGSINNSLIFNTIQYNFLGAQFPSSIGNFGISFMYAGFGNIDHLDNSGNSVNMASSNDLGLILNYSIDLKETMPVEFMYGGLGVNLKLLRSNLADYSAEAFAADIGGIFRFADFDNISLGVAYKNFGSKMKFIKESYDLPQVLSVGAAYSEKDFFNLKVAIDYNSQIYSGNFFSAGASFSPIYFLDLRSGVKLAEKSLDTDFRMGFALEIQSVTIDYSYAPGQNIDGTHSVNLSCALGSFASEKTAYDYYLKEHFRKAVNIYNRKDYIKAREAFGEILAVYPDHATSQKYLKKINEELSYVDAYNASLNSKYMTKANNALALGDVVKARRYYNKVLSMDPENLLAKSGIEKTEAYTSEVLKERNRDKNRKRIEYLWKRFKKFYKDGDLVNAKESLAFILDIDHENDAAKTEMTNVDNQLAKIASDKISELYNKGRALFDKGNYEDSIRYFEAIVIASPSRADVRGLLASAKKNVKNAVQYENDKKATIAQGKVRDKLDKMYERALNYYDENNLDKAMVYFKKSKELADKYNFADYSKSSREYMSKISKDLSDIYYRKGFEFFSKNKFEEAFKEYKLAIEYNPSNASAVAEYNKTADNIAQKYYEQGMSYYSRGDFTNAAVLLRKALVYRPDKMEVKRALEKMQ
ncbi:MAG: PorV/PorQ family protein [Endomicrobium sp.]|jgi:tetratricopeptide (TPR) repeat protein|nr:PorV/PorQ family protein [Endomicrobium sp.]